MCIASVTVLVEVDLSVNSIPIPTYALSPAICLPLVSLWSCRTAHLIIVTKLILQFHSTGLPFVSGQSKNIKPFHSGLLVPKHECQFFVTNLAPQQSFHVKRRAALPWSDGTIWQGKKAPRTLDDKAQCLVIVLPSLLFRRAIRGFNDVLDTSALLTEWADV